MKELTVLVLLSSAVLLCSAAPALEQVTCSEDGGAAAARLAVFRINENHDHGYKFQLSETLGSKVEKVDSGCNIELQLNLLETKCHVVNPKHFEDCELRDDADREVMANCTVMMTVRNNDAEVTKYECGMQKAKTNMEMVRMCPDCPMLISLTNPEGLKSVNEGVKRFNQNTTNQHYYILQEVGRMKSGYIMMVGMMYYAEFVLVETHCLRESRIRPEACKPLCPDRAHHAVCRSSYARDKGFRSLDCEFYPPSNTTDLGPGEQSVCGPPHPPGFPPPPGPPRPPGPPPHASGGGPPPHASGGGPPPHARGGGPPPHGQGPPPHAQGPPPHGQGPPPGQERLHHRLPLHPFHSCHGLLTNFDPALHPICPWPHAEPYPNPNQSQS